MVLDKVECDDDDSGVADPEDPNSLTVNLAADETVICTYFDRAIPPESGTLIVEKTTEPADDPTPFPSAARSSVTSPLPVGRRGRSSCSHPARTR